MGASSASAATAACGTGTLITGTTTCQQVFTSPGTFTPTAQMTKLEVLLVGGGGNGSAAPPVTGTAGYAAAGGGGEVKVVDFSTHNTTLITVTPGAAGVQTSVTATGITANAGAGGIGQLSRGAAVGGASGGTPSNLGSSTADTATPPNTYGAGGGAGGAASGITGGAGILVSTLPSALFTNDTQCFGGGGAVAMSGTAGLPGCGGGSANATGTALSLPVANSGGGGGAGLAANGESGAAGYVEIRWNAPTVVLSFNHGRGSAVADETVVQGTAPTKPADPTASGFEFKGWYTDAQLTTLADFSAPLTASATFYARFDPALAATGGAPNPVELPIGIAALLAGAALLTVSTVRRRREDY